MKLSAYIVRFDSGFAPNPFGGICTLACCKPTIRRNANRGDIIVGIGSVRTGLSGRLVYAMRVKSVLSFDEYWNQYPDRRPSSRTAISQCGDNIWYSDESGNWRCVAGAFHSESEREHDLGGRRVLVASDFYYFGREAIVVPTRFQGLIATARGHKNSRNIGLINQFWSWLENEAPQSGRIGLPSDFSDDAIESCEAHRASEVCGDTHRSTTC